MDISAIHWHDTVITGVAIDPDSDNLVMDVRYPVDWQLSKFEPRKLYFDEAWGYQSYEGPCIGCPAIIDAVLTEKDGRWSRLRLDTNQGYQSLWCTDVRLI